MPVLCVAGVLEHPCDCGGTADCAGESGCGHGGTCPHDPCQRAVITRSDEHTHHAELAASVAQPGVLMDLYPVRATAPPTATAASPARSGGLLALPFPPSEIPLRI